MRRTTTAILMLATAGLGSAAPAAAQIATARVGDVTHLQGQGVNRVQGYGLVAGLNGTGDGDAYLETMQRLRNLMERFGGSVPSLSTLKGTRSVAIVMVTATIPEHGAREGELLDLTVSTVGAAKSVAGGQLLSTPLIYPGYEELFGLAEGRIIVDETTPTRGRVPRGARMERDVFINVIASGVQLLEKGISSPWIGADEQYLTLVLEETHAGWPMAAAVAQAVDKELSLSADVERVALAVDPKNVVVLLPRHQRNDPASWIRDVQRTPLLMESNEARVTINRSAGTLVVTGDTRISPVIVSQQGMTITVFNPAPDGTVPRPAVERQDFVAIGVQDRPESNLRDLLEALNRLKVGFDARVAILEEIHRAGKLHARLVYEQ
ncbi:MAG TPA: flagellar basal body P-ring protein FlgI [Phycisphaerae bacterium]|nr:flagellar basal body P-ring protein FlgI [Phycisphaerae bacterium]HNU46733.1 flagellar basal body P-ring protein FlgI [Phycisphaerae bacterium]